MERGFIAFCFGIYVLVSVYMLIAVSFVFVFLFIRWFVLCLINLMHLLTQLRRCTNKNNDR
jgi:hypothetical protein